MNTNPSTTLPGLLQALNNLDESLLDLPLVLLHGKHLSKPNLVNGIIPAPIPVNQNHVEAKGASPSGLCRLAECEQHKSDFPVERADHLAIRLIDEGRLLN